MYGHNSVSSPYHQICSIIPNIANKEIHPVFQKYAHSPRKLEIILHVQTVNVLDRNGSHLYTYLADNEIYITRDWVRRKMGNKSVNKPLTFSAPNR